MKRTLLLVSLGFVLSTNVSFSQMTTRVVEPASDSHASSSLMTALKPADGKPYQFSSKTELENAVPKKIEGIKDQISAGNLTDAQVKELREQIWRFENATVTK